MDYKAERFKLHVFVCDGNRVHPGDHVGWVTLERIFMERHSRCRYAVAERSNGTFVVWDFYSGEWLLSPTYSVRSAFPPPCGEYEDLDQAIMALTLDYDRDKE